MQWESTRRAHRRFCAGDAFSLWGIAPIRMRASRVPPAPSPRRDLQTYSSAPSPLGSSGVAVLTEESLCYSFQRLVAALVVNNNNNNNNKELLSEIAGSDQTPRCEVDNRFRKSRCLPPPPSTHPSGVLPLSALGNRWFGGFYPFRYLCLSSCFRSIRLVKHSVRRGMNL